MSINAMKQALEALENSVDLVQHEYTDAVELYGKYPTRAAKIDGLLALQKAHEDSITALRQAIEVAEKQKIEAIARVDDLERGGRVRALALGLGLDEILYARINHEPN
jgi:hypothetical protein